MNTVYSIFVVYNLISLFRIRISLDFYFFRFSFNETFSKYALDSESCFNVEFSTHPSDFFQFFLNV